MSGRAGAGTEMLSRQFHEFRRSIFFFSTRVLLKFTEIILAYFEDKVAR